ncbi:MAG TPA: hypothetical protein VIK93_02665 [Limnochordales bacterium]
MSTAVPLRKDVPVEHTWDVHSIFPSDEAWEEALQALAARMPGLSAFRGRLSEGPHVVADCLQTVDKLLEDAGKLYQYGMMRFSVDTSDQQAASLHAREQSLFAQFTAAMAFLEPELLAIGPERLLEWADQEPRLAIYKHYFDTLARQKAHVRSAEVEELLGMVMDPFRTATGVHGTIASWPRWRPTSTRRWCGRTSLRRSRTPSSRSL